jgi:nucleoside-diphosphate-sugar epimerase
MKLLVTGGAGYIGSTLVRLLLENGHQVRVLDSLMYGGDSLLGCWPNPKFEFIKGDIRDESALDAAVRGVEAVVHLAAIVGDPACARDPEETRAVNLEASLSLLGKSRAAGVERFIFASTCSNYGRMDDPSQLADETWELRPVSLYAETKVAVEEAILDLQSTDFTPTVLRFATVFGVSPRMRFDLTVNEFTLDLITKEELVVFGEQFWRPYAHVADIARAVVQVLGESVDKIGNQVFNVGSTEQNFQKQQLVDLIKPYAPYASIEYVERTEDPRDYRVSFEKIKKVLRFEIEHSVEDGIREVAQLIRDGLISDTDDGKYRN